MAFIIKELYKRYFQKSRSFIFPILGIKKNSAFVPMQTYLAWEDQYKIEDNNLIVTYKKVESSAWTRFLVETLLSSEMFNEYYETEEKDVIVVCFDLNFMKADYSSFLEGKYSNLSKLLKKKIRDFHGYDTPEWAYMETFLFPDKYVKVYSKLLAVDEEHIKVTGELCNIPDLEKETLKIKTNGKINDVDQINMEHRGDFQDDTNKSGMSL